MPSRFIVLSLPRCGSTTLMNALNCHPVIRCLREPFNPDQSGDEYLGRVHDLASLDLAITSIWQTHNGFKHVWDPSGWPFGCGMEFNLHLATRPGTRVLLLTRKNHLQRIVSYELAVQTNLWQREDLPLTDGSQTGPGSRLTLVDPAMLRRNIYLARIAVETVKGTLMNNQVPFFQVSYEELFAPYATIGEGLRRLNEIADFLSAGPFADNAERQAHDLFDADLHKLNTVLTYRAVPNAETIESLCGNEENGHLFEEEPGKLPEETSCASLSSPSRAAEARR
jgi:LPS sulfotransferase NodH